MLRLVNHRRGQALGLAAVRGRGPSGGYHPNGRVAHPESGGARDHPNGRSGRPRSSGAAQPSRSPPWASRCMATSALGDPIPAGAPPTEMPLLPADAAAEAVLGGVLGALDSAPTQADLDAGPRSARPAAPSGPSRRGTPPACSAPGCARRRTAGCVAVGVPPGPARAKWAKWWAKWAKCAKSPRTDPWTRQRAALAGMRAPLAEKPGPCRRHTRHGSCGRGSGWRASSSSSQTTTGKYRFRLKASNGQVIAASQGYASKKSALEGIESVRKHAPEAETVEVEE